MLASLKFGTYTKMLGVLVCSKSDLSGLYQMMLRVRNHLSLLSSLAFISWVFRTSTYLGILLSSAREDLESYLSVESSVLNLDFDLSEDYWT